MASSSRILIVDDDSQVRDLLVLAIEGLGHAVASADSAAAARALLGQQRFDLVITDAKLPDGNGVAIADLAKATGIAAVILTGYAPETRPEGPQHDYLFKPIRHDDLARAVARYLGAR